MCVHRTNWGKGKKECKGYKYRVLMGEILKTPEFLKSEKN